MGCVFSCENNNNIPWDSPLGLILKSWWQLTHRKTSLLKPKLIGFSVKMWPTYELDNDETWPEFSSSDKKLISNLMSHIHEDRYFEELEYARLFRLLSCQQSPSDPKKEQPVLLLRKKKEKKNKREQSIWNSGHEGKEEAELDLVAPALRTMPALATVTLVEGPAPALVWPFHSLSCPCQLLVGCHLTSPSSIIHSLSHGSVIRAWWFLVPALVKADLPQQTQQSQLFSGSSSKEEDRTTDALNRQMKGKIVRKALRECSPIAKGTRSIKETREEPVLQALLW